ncbi:MAG: helix-turn-helix transcriptional regulator [Eggerthellaceae bacterium]|nr:helix-turn-helix transcriptional regulator [Eggerthellaceae bacterium]
MNNRDYSYEAMGRRLDSGLADRGITPDDLAAMMPDGVTGYVVREWIRGRTKIPIDKACLICDIFNWPLDRLAVRGPEAVI